MTFVVPCPFAVVVFFISKMLSFTVQLIWKFWGHFYLCICVEWSFV